MIFSKRGTIYDTSDQTEHRRTDPGEESLAVQRWVNEGGGPREEARPGTFQFAGELTVKPAWSVLSLEALNEAIRREAQAKPDDTPRPTRAASLAIPPSVHGGNAWEYAYEPPPAGGQAKV